jgi:hypothetical protein
LGGVMRFPIILILYMIEASAMWAIGPVAPFANRPAVEFALNIALGVALLAAPILVGSYARLVVTRHVVTAIGRSWCHENDKEFVRTEIHKNHFAVIFREDATNRRSKFRCRFGWFPWSAPRVHWLAS